MAKIGTVWDSALDAVRGRLGTILPFAAGALFLPSVIQTGLQSYLVRPGAPATGAVAALGLVAIPLMLVTLWGALAITAITSHPDTTSGDAGRQATARILPLVGVWLTLGLAASLFVLPLIALLAAAGFDFAAAGSPGYRPEFSGATALVAVLYMLVVFGLFLWLLARLLPLVPVVLHERLGMGAIGRAFRMTRGMGGRLVGLLILYVVVVGVASLAVTSVLGLLFRLLLGEEDAATAAFLGGVAGAVVSTALAVISYAFVARLYASLSGRDLRAVFEDEPVR